MLMSEKEYQRRRKARNKSKRKADNFAKSKGSTANQVKQQRERMNKTRSILDLY